MPGEAAKTIITERQKEILRTFSRSVTAPSLFRHRAAIIILAFEGLLNGNVAQCVGLTHRRVGRLRRRWANAWNQLIDIECCESRTDLRRTIEAVLAEEPRPGAPDKFTPEQVTQFLDVARKPHAKTVLPITHWMIQDLIDEVIQRGNVASISDSHIYHYLREAALQPQNSRHWLYTTETDPTRFEVRVKAVCDRISRQPERERADGSHTVCVDEMTGLQSLERNAPDRAMIAGKCQLIEFEYPRDGTLCLTGNFVVTAGELLAPTIGLTQTEADCASHIERAVATDPVRFVGVCGGQLEHSWLEELGEVSSRGVWNPHRSRREAGRGVLKSAASRQAFVSESGPRIWFLYLPKHSSLLNQIEVVFGVIMRKVFRRGSFISVGDLRTKLSNLSHISIACSPRRAAEPTRVVRS